MNIITATHYNGSLRLGYGASNTPGERLGEDIEVYRNPISQFFARVHKRSMDIEIDGKIRCVDKKSFKSHLESIGLGDIQLENIKQISYENLIKDKTISTSGTKIHEDFSVEKQRKLLGKLMGALAREDTQAVNKLKRKGVMHQTRPSILISLVLESAAKAKGDNMEKPELKRNVRTGWLRRSTTFLPERTPLV